VILAPTVSIISPLFNCSLYLSETIESILSQTYMNWELILIDDFSSDNSLVIAQKYSTLDSRIKVYSLNKNSGPAASRNKGIDMAQGRYIAFCDSDDIWLPEKLEKQIAAIKSSDSAICFTSYFKMAEDGTYTNRLVKAEPLVTYSMLLRSNYIGCSTAIYDTEKCGKVLMPDILKRQDYGLWLCILQQGHHAIGLAEPLVYYRIRSKSISSNKVKAALYHWKVLRQVTEVSLPFALLLFLQYVWKGIRKNNI
jgi:teichuronic acid biosynthesis glycosyltransferase TuaG